MKSKILSQYRRSSRHRYLNIPTVPNKHWGLNTAEAVDIGTYFAYAYM